MKEKDMSKIMGRAMAQGRGGGAGKTNSGRGRMGAPHHGRHGGGEYQLLCFWVYGLLTSSKK